MAFKGSLFDRAIAPPVKKLSMKQWIKRVKARQEAMKQKGELKEAEKAVKRAIAKAKKAEAILLRATERVQNGRKSQ